MKYTTVYAFTGGADGSDANGLTLGTDGNLYGTTLTGGSAGYGTVYKLTPAGALTTIYSFTGGSDGNGPNPLTLGSDGNFYSTTSGALTGHYGTVFKITTSGALTTLYTFTGANDGAYPNALTLGSDGNLYGTTYNLNGSSGAGSDGTVFKITPSGALSTIYSFIGGADGAQPFAALAVGPAGSFYGTTSTAGSGGEGTVFKVTTAGTLTTIYSFGGGVNGDSPSNITVGTDGNLYATQYGGGDSNGDGQILKITPAGVLTTLYVFSGGADGANPDTALTVGADGTLYGTTEFGGDSAGDGTIFQLTLSGTFTTLFTFVGQYDGANPDAPLTAGPNGVFYGTTSADGANGYGTDFSLATEIPTTQPYDFNGDGHNDLLWSNSSTGQVSTWLMNGSSNLKPLEEGPVLATVAPSTGWSVSTAADLNGDGHPDLVWHNSKTGQLSTWLMNGTTVKQEGPVITTVSDLNANVISCPDINNDGHNDLMWYDSHTGSVSVWLMNGTTVIQSGLAVGAVAPSSGWHPIGTADFDGDGHPDILWENSQTGAHSVWYLNGTTVRNYSALFATDAPSTGWHVKSVADYDGDGHPDLIFENSQTGQVSLLLLNGTGGTSVKQSGPIFASVAPSTGWSIVGGK